MPSWVSKRHEHCRVCQAPLGKPFLDLGEQPLANALVSPPVWIVRGNSSIDFSEMYPGKIFPIPEDMSIEPLAPREEQRFPLQVILCEQCGLSQLSVVVNPEILYSGYRFRSGVSNQWKDHCEDLAHDVTAVCEKGSVLDIAANDGTQLSMFRMYGWDVEGVDPCPLTTEFPMYAEMWSESLATTIAHRKTFDLVIAQNVLGHVDDPISFLKAIKTVLAPEGRAVIEVPRLGDLILGCAFDTIYHEHLTYWAPAPLKRAAALAGLVEDGCEDIPIHGGSFRLWLRHGDAVPESRIPAHHAAMLQCVLGAFAQRVEENLQKTFEIIVEYVESDEANNYQVRKMLGWGASAKAAVYLNAFVSQAEIPTQIQAVVDDCVEKQGLLMPGVHIPIIAPPDDLSDVDVIWVLSWNNFDSIANKARSRHFTGKFLVTHPEPRLIDA